MSDPSPDDVVTQLLPVDGAASLPRGRADESADQAGDAAAVPDWAAAPDLASGVVDFGELAQRAPPLAAPPEDETAALLEVGLGHTGAYRPGSTPPAGASPLTSGGWRAVSIEAAPDEPDRRARLHARSKAARAREAAREWASRDMTSDVDDLETSLLAAMAAPSRRADLDASAEEALAASVDALASSLAAAMDSIERGPEGDALLAEYQSRPGGLDRAPEQTRAPDTVDRTRWEREAYEVIELVDGHRSFREIIRRSGLKEVHVAYLLATLLEEALIR